MSGLSILKIAGAAAAEAGLSRDVVLGASQADDVTRARERAIYLTRQLRPDLGQSAIARAFLRDPSTVSRAAERVANRVTCGDLEEARALSAIRARLGLTPADSLRALADELAEQLAVAEAAMRKVRDLHGRVASILAWRVSA